MNTLTLNAYQLADEIRNGNISAEDHMARVLERIKGVDDRVHAYITLNENALNEARDLDKRKERRGRLFGIPLAVKDNICTKGIKTTCASKMLADFISPYDATVIERLKEEGAIIIGKTNLDEFGMGSSTEFSCFEPTRNPWDLERVAGGSSGGSAAAVAALEATIALGSDTGGSVRCPASFCSCVGLKPTYGLVSRYGLVSYANSMEQIGPITRSVYDAALILTCMAGKDERDNTTHESIDYTKDIEKGIDGVKISIVKEMLEGADESVRKDMYSAVERFESLGASVDEVSIPSFKYALASYYTIAMAEASSNLARYDGIRYGSGSNPEGVAWNAYYSSARSNFGNEVKRRIMIGTYILSSGYYGKYYLKAQKVRAMIRNDIERIFKEKDLLISPTMPVLPFRLGERIDDPIKLYLADIDTVIANLAGIPAISIPSTFRDGLPVGVQLMSKHDNEEMLLRAAYAFERINDLRMVPEL